MVSVFAAGAFVLVCLCGHVADAGADRPQAAPPGGFYVHRALSDEEEEVFRWLPQSVDWAQHVDPAYWLAPPGHGAWAQAGRKMPAAERVLCDLVRKRTVWFYLVSVARALEWIATNNSAPTRVSLYERGEGRHLERLRSLAAR